MMDGWMDGLVDPPSSDFRLRRNSARQVGARRSGFKTDEPCLYQARQGDTSRYWAGPGAIALRPQSWMVDPRAGQPIFRSGLLLIGRDWSRSPRRFRLRDPF